MSKEPKNQAAPEQPEDEETESQNDESAEEQAEEQAEETAPKTTGRARVLAKSEGGVAKIVHKDGNTTRVIKFTERSHGKHYREQAQEHMDKMKKIKGLRGTLELVG